MFSREICEIFQNIYFEEHFRTTASVVTKCCFWYQVNWSELISIGLKSSESHRFSDDLRRNRSISIRLNLLNSRNEIWRRPLSCLATVKIFLTFWIYSKLILKKPGLVVLIRVTFRKFLICSIVVYTDFELVLCVKFLFREFQYQCFPVKNNLIM